MASTTTSQSARAARRSTAVSRVWARCMAVVSIRPLTTSLPHADMIPSMAFFRAAASLSNSRTWSPACAASCAMPRPIVPTPITPTIFTEETLPALMSDHLGQSQDRCRLAACGHATIAMHKCGFRSLYLARPALASQLAHGLDDGKRSIHVGMHTRQTATVGVDRQTPTRRNDAVFHKMAAFAFLAEAQVFQE